LLTSIEYWSAQLAASAELAQSKIAVKVKRPGFRTDLGQLKAATLFGVSMDFGRLHGLTDIDIEMTAMRQDFEIENESTSLQKSVGEGHTSIGAPRIGSKSVEKNKWEGKKESSSGAAT
jgi:hypothetical protein